MMNRINEEKLLNEMFVILEYSDSFNEFVDSLSNDCKLELVKALDRTVWEVKK